MITFNKNDDLLKRIEAQRQRAKIDPNFIWENSEIPYKKLKDGHIILAKNNKNEVYVFEWNYERNAFGEFETGEVVTFNSPLLSIWADIGYLIGCPKLNMNKTFEWRTDPIPFKDFKDGQQILCCFDKNSVGLYEWDKEEQDIYDAEIGGDVYTPEEFNKILKAWTYYEYPGKEAE